MGAIDSMAIAGSAGLSGVRIALTALLAMLMPALGQAEQSTGPSLERGEAALREAMLARHNDERRAHGVPPLVWSEALAADAQRSANRLAMERDPVAAHGKGHDTDGQGENLWAGSRDAYAYHEMTEAWLDERSLYINGPVPEISRSGNWADVGHYSQIVWSSTRHIGCALVNNAALDVLVCRYDPAGNIYGRTALMDLAAR
jgi:hypothetical protein